MPTSALTGSSGSGRATLLQAGSVARWRLIYPELKEIPR